MIILDYYFILPVSILFMTNCHGIGIFALFWISSNCVVLLFVKLVINCQYLFIFCLLCYVKDKIGIYSIYTILNPRHIFNDIVFSLDKLFCLHLYTAIGFYTQFTLCIVIPDFIFSLYFFDFIKVFLY